MTPGENCYILGYIVPNEIYKYVPERTQVVVSLVKFSDSEDKTVTHGSLYNLAILNNLETGHLGKPLISPNW